MENKICSFGIAGNFTGHLEQAGEANDFLQVKTLDSNAPKAIFPTYINNINSSAPDFLKTYPFDSEKIIFPENELKLQIEPECGLICNLKWENNKITSIIPVKFGASNDCSIRKEGAKKISQKKNWGKSSKGLSDNLIPLNSFNSSGNINDYRIASYIKRNNEVYIYGENSAVCDYSYIYEKLISWMLDKFNNQCDEGPAEKIIDYLITADKPEQIMVSIGATRYTEFGQNNFLQKDDITYVILYSEKDYTEKEIFEMVKTDKLDDERISSLIQKVIL